MVWSQYLYLLSGIACSTSRPTKYFMNTMLTSPTSIEAEVLIGLLGNFGNCGHRRPRLVQHHVLDVLRPDCREPGESARGSRDSG
jgi:hypothetical protein